MNKKLQKVVSLLLIVVVFLTANSSIAQAAPMYAEDSRGGTWIMTSYNTTESIIELPRKIVYLPYSKVKDLHNADLPTGQLREALAIFSAEVITTALVERLKTVIGVNLAPCVGVFFTVGDFLACAMSDSFNSGINNAYRSSTGMKYVVYQGNGGDRYFRCSNWSGNLMYYQQTLPYNSGYATGYVNIGTYDWAVYY